MTITLLIFMPVMQNIKLLLIFKSWNYGVVIYRHGH